MYQTHTHTSKYNHCTYVVIQNVYLTYRTAGEQLVNMVDCNGWTPLHYACYDDNKELIEQLMEAGADKWARYFFDSSCPIIVYSIVIMSEGRKSGNSCLWLLSLQ